MPEDEIDLGTTLTRSIFVDDPRFRNAGN
jgi:hypothetical protein